MPTGCLKESSREIAQNFRSLLEPSFVAAFLVDAIDASRKFGATSILLLLERCHFLLRAANLRFSSASQGQKFFLTAEI